MTEHRRRRRFWRPPATAPSGPTLPALGDFPLSFGQLRDLYGGFTPHFEPHRVSLSTWLSDLREGADLTDIRDALATAEDGRPPRVLLQRHFYWSATCAIRAFDLFLAVLTLERRGLWSWALTTGYYSRFYLAKALTNLWLGSWVTTEVVAPRPHRPPAAELENADLRYEDLLVYWGTDGPRLLRARRASQHPRDAVVPVPLAARGSHERWWRFAAELLHARDVPGYERFAFVLTDTEYSLQRRTDVNYADAYMKGFPELEWFDHASAAQMLTHARADRRREDRDFTAVDRYFADDDPASVELGDFHTDSAQVLWLGALTWLDTVRALGIRQTLVTPEKLTALAARVLREDFPRVLAGIASELRQRDA